MARKKVLLDEVKADWTLLLDGSSGSPDIEKAWLRCAQETYKLFCEKQHDYGPDNIAVGGRKGLALRLGDKTARLWTVYGLSSDGERECAVEDEPPRKTLIDIADYGIIGMILEDGCWPSKTVQEAFGRRAVEKILSEMKE